MNCLILLGPEDLGTMAVGTPLKEIEITDTKLTLTFAALADIILYHDGNSVKVLKNRRLNYYKTNHVYKGNLSDFIGKCLQENVAQNKTIMEG